MKRESLREELGDTKLKQKPPMPLNREQQTGPTRDVADSKYDEDEETPLQKMNPETNTDIRERDMVKFRLPGKGMQIIKEGLQEEFGKLEAKYREKVEEAKELLERSEKQRKELEDLRTKYHVIFVNQKAKIDHLSQRQLNDREAIQQLEAEADVRARKLSESESIIHDKDIKVQRLQEKIVELTARGGLLGVRDDDYFAEQFGALYLSCIQWANRYFRTKHPITVETLPDGLEKGIQKIARDPASIFSLPKTSRARARIVCGIMGHIFTSYMQEGSPVIGVPGLGRKVTEFWHYFEGSKKDKQRWFSLTSALIANSPLIKTQQFDGLRLAANAFIQFLEPLADKEPSSSEMLEGLLKIFTHFAKIRLEAAQQDSVITLRSLHSSKRLADTSIPFNPQLMEDVDGIEEDDELVERGAVVSIVEFPALYKSVFDADGNYVEPRIVISKLKASCKEFEHSR